MAVASFKMALQKDSLFETDVLAPSKVDKAIAGRSVGSDNKRGLERKGKLPKPWWH